MTDKIEKYEEEPPEGWEDDLPEWFRLGYNTEEDYIKAQQEEDQKRDIETLRAIADKERDEREREESLYEANEEFMRNYDPNEEDILRAIQDGTYYTPEKFAAQQKVQQEHQILENQKEIEEFKAKNERSFDEVMEKYGDSLVGLKGDSYRAATKMVFYSVIANQLKDNYFYVDGKKIDLRIPLLIMLKAGHGKKEYRKFISKTIQDIGKVYAEPTSYHPEQFIGKVKERKLEDDMIAYEKIDGILKADYILLDEAYELLTSKKDEYQESLKYIRTALDPIGENDVEKKQVDIPEKEKLKYSPRCTISLMTQPITEVNEDLLIKGSFRRFAIIMIDTTLEERIRARESAKFLYDKQDVDKERWNNWIEYNKKFLKYKLNILGKDDDFKSIDDYINKILYGLQDEKSQEGLEFANSIQYNIKYLLFKMAIIRAIVEQMNEKIVIEKRHIDGAIRDFDVIWRPQVSWIRKKMVIKSDKPKDWRDVHNWIYENVQMSDRLQKDVIDKYAEKNKGTFSDNTLRQYCQRAIKELKQWGYIIDEPTGNKNERILKVKK